MGIELITLTPRNTDKGIQWEICQASKNTCGGPGVSPTSVYPEIVIDKGTDPLVLFQIKREPGGPAGISFKTDPASSLSAAEAFYVTPGKGQNPGKGHKSNGQFDDIVLASPTALVFKDNNTKSESFSYKLHFNGGVTSIDPDITNGGKTFAISEALVTTLIAGAIVAALVAAAVATFIARRVTQNSLAAHKPTPTSPSA